MNFFRQISRACGFDKDPDIRTELGFAEFYSKYVIYVLSVCHDHLDDELVCEDITAVIFMSLWERREDLYRSIPDDKSRKQYLIRAVRNKVYDHIRKQGQSNRYIAAIEREISLSENAVEKDIYYGELANEVDSLVKKLPPRCQEVFLLSRVQGFTHREIANKLLISENAVKKHISKALMYLRENLTDFIDSNQSTG